MIMAAEKMLRGRAALTVVRGTPGRHVYRNEVVDPRLVYPEDTDRLVAEGFLEWVVKKGEDYTLVQDGPSGDAGDSVTVGTTSADVSPQAQQSEGNDPADPGLTNSPAKTEAPAVDTAAAEVEKRRAAARAKLPSDGSAPDGRAADQVYVEYLVGKGYGRVELEKTDREELKKLVAEVSSKS